MALGDYGKTLASQPLSPTEIDELREAQLAKDMGRREYETRRLNVAKGLAEKRMLKGTDRDERGRLASFHTHYKITPVGTAALRLLDKQERERKRAVRRKPIAIGKRVV